MKHLKSHFIYAGLASVITTLIVLFELLFLSAENRPSFESLIQNKNFYLTLTCTYLLVFILNYILSLVCTIIVCKFLKNWILIFCASFVIYFVLLSAIIYASILIGEPQTTINFATFMMTRLKTDIILSLQNFTIAFAFIRLANKQIALNKA